MKASNELFKLIKSLTKSEKRFFKMFSELQSGEKNYIRMFDFIEKQNDFNEEALKLHFADEIFIQHLPSEKNFLTKTILKSLRQFHSDTSSTGRLGLEVRNVQILYQKGLFSSCKKALKRAKEKAIASEHLHHLYEILSWEKRLIDIDVEQGDFTSNLELIQQEESLVLNQLQNLAEYQILYTKINTIFRTGGFVRNEDEQKIVEEIADNYLIKGKNTAISVNATSICYYIKGLCAATSRDYENAFVFFKKVKDVLDKNVLIRSELTTRYVQNIGHLIHCCFDSNNVEEANNLLLLLNTLKLDKEFAHEETSFLIENIENQLNWGMLIRENKFEEALIQISKNQKTFSNYYLEKSREIQLVENYHVAYSNFALGNFKIALKLINDLLNDPDQRLRKDIFCYTRILNFMTHTELGNFDHVAYVAKGNAKRMQTEKISYPMEIFVNKHFEQIEADKTLTIMKTDLSKFQKENGELFLFASLDIPNWIEAYSNKLTLKKFMDQNN